MPDARRKLRQGEVVSDKMDKTVLVAVRWQQRHRLYKKSIRRITRFFAHDRNNECKLGDVVRIEETRHLSKMKNWRVVEIVQRREVAEVKPAELDEGLLSEERERAAGEALAVATAEAGDVEDEEEVLDAEEVLDDEEVDEEEEDGAEEGGPEAYDGDEDGAAVHDDAEDAKNEEERR